MIGERPDTSGRWSHPQALIEAAIAQLVELPEQLPVLLCKGLCHDSCASVPLTPVELGRVETALGRTLTVDPEGLRCGALGEDNRCGAYNVRPLICRLWGMSESMMCPHGCVTTTGQYLEYWEVIGLLARAQIREGSAVLPMFDDEA